MFKKYNVLKTVEIKFSERNDETDNEPFFEQLQNKKDSLGSAITALRHHNKDGLEKDEAIKEIQEATEQGNQLITLVGTDSEGDNLRGNNDKFQIKKSIPEPSGNLDDDALSLYNSFKSLIKDGIIKVPKVKKAVKQKLLSLIEQHC